MQTLHICICTYNRLGYLQRCLEQLLPQIKTHAVELSVVDNHSSDGTKAYAQSLAQTHAQLHYLHVEKQGLSHARNTAWKNSANDWIFYLDDDCLPSPTIVEEALRLINSDTPVDAYGGPIDSIFEGEMPGWWPVGFGSFSMPFTKTTVLEKGFIRGGCFLIRQEVLEKLNGFDERLGVTGTQLQYGEEIELQLRMRQSGNAIAYAPTLRTGHFVRPDKLSLRWVLHSVYARRRDKMLFEPVSLATASVHLVKTIFGRLLWIPVHLGEAIFNPGYSLKKALYDIAQPLAFSFGEWIGVMKSSRRN